jgi:hypothetical protein
MKSAFCIATVSFHLRGDRALKPIIAQPLGYLLALSARQR